MLVKTAELTDAALDWAVAKCEGKTKLYQRRNGALRTIDSGHPEYAKDFLRSHDCYSTDWSKGGPIIERECMTVHCWRSPSRPYATMFTIHLIRGEGETPLIAAMRCYVTSKMGDEVDVPQEVYSPSFIK